MTTHDDLARELHYLKIAAPRVEGGYGIMFTEESETILSLCTHIEQLPSNERVLHLNLSTAPTTLKLRPLINTLLKEDTGREEIETLTNKLQLQKGQHANFYTVVVIEHAQRLNVETFRWILANMRIIDLFILVFPNEKAFNQLVRRSGLNEGWAHGRGIHFDEEAIPAQPLDKATE